MSIIRHKHFGEGNIIAKEGNRITVRFSKDSSEKDFIIPLSFMNGLFDLEGSALKKEVEAAIENAKKEREARMAAAEKNKTVPSSTGRKASKKTPAKISLRNGIEKDFEIYLIKSGYSVETPMGNPSTVYTYINAINTVLEEERLTHSALVNNIGTVLPIYDTNGPKEDIGNKSNKVIINALRRFDDFIKNSSVTTNSLKRSA